MPGGQSTDPQLPGAGVGTGAQEHRGQNCPMSPLCTVARRSVLVHTQSTVCQRGAARRADAPATGGPPPVPRLTPCGPSSQGGHRHPSPVTDGRVCLQPRTVAQLREEGLGFWSLLQADSPCSFPLHMVTPFSGTPSPSELGLSEDSFCEEDQGGVTLTMVTVTK